MTISAKDVKTLREKTGAGLMDCKKALNESGGDTEKAILFLREKGLDVLFDAYASLKAEMKDAALLVAGDGPMRAECEARVADEMLEDVRFLGFVAQGDLPEVYIAADVFVLPSLVEPWGVVVNEAMACALPVVSSDQVGASADLIEEGANGFVVPSGDSLLLSRRLQDVLGDEKRRGEMGAKSREIISGWDYAASARNFAAAVEYAVRRGGRG